MRAFKLKDFARAAKREGVPDEALADALERAGRGLIDGEIGECLIKQRIARPGQGRSGGLRVVMVYKDGTRAVLLHLFPKSSKANLTPTELKSYRRAAKIMVGLSDDTILALVNAGDWIEINHESRKNLSQRSAPIDPSGDDGPS